MVIRRSIRLEQHVSRGARFSGSSISEAAVSLTCESQTESRSMRIGAVSSRSSRSNESECGFQYSVFVDAVSVFS